MSSDAAGGGVDRRDRCPVCDGEPTLFRSAGDVENDLQSMVGLVNAERSRNATVKVMHLSPADVMRCASCSTMWRRDVGDDSACEDSLVDRYRQDEYDFDQLNLLHARTLAEAARDSAWFEANGVVAGARVLEVGCYVGAFMSMASAMGATVEGLDPNPQLAAYCRSRGLEVRTGVLADFDGGRTFDVVAVLNCFDQLPSPEEDLLRAAGMLRAGGRLLLRTPDAEWLSTMYDDERKCDVAARSLVLGVPFVRCYSIDAIGRILAEAGFDEPAIRLRPARTAQHPDSRDLSPWLDISATRKAHRAGAVV